jgi:hypothetical protein
LVKVLEYRRRAQACRVLAEKSDSLKDRAKFLTMAHSWDELAKGREQNAREGYAGRGA